MQAACKRRRAGGEKVGAGFAIFVEKSGLGPFDKVRIDVAPSGAIEVVTGVASIGQGVETAIAQIAAETLGVDYAAIKVVHGQTDRIDKGLGRLCLARHGDVRRSNPHGRGQAARRKRSHAAAELMQTSRRYARHRRRRHRAHRRPPGPRCGSPTSPRRRTG